MNQRIDQLMIKAGAYFGGDGVVYDTFDPKKFAHLLMREIMRVQVSYQTGMDLENRKMDNPARELTRAVIEHFGVEE